MCVYVYIDTCALYTYMMMYVNIYASAAKLSTCLGLQTNVPYRL